jgi:hypothetical protein
MPSSILVPGSPVPSVSVQNRKRASYFLFADDPEGRRMPSVGDNRFIFLV